MAGEHDASGFSFSQRVLQWEAANGWAHPGIDLVAIVLVPVYLVALVARLVKALSSRLARSTSPGEHQ